MKRLWLCVLLTACEDPSSETPYALCDGSEGVRLAIMNGGGQVETTYPFTNPYGWQFLFVTGRCGFLAQPDLSANSGYLIGTFTKVQADELAARLGPLSGKTYRASGGCLDASTTQVITADGYAERVCGDEPPASITDVLGVVERGLSLARDNGTPANGAVELVAIGDYYELDSRDAVPWPLSLPISEASVQWSTTNGAPDYLQHVRAVTGDDAALARGLRNSGNASGNVQVTWAGKDYALFMRDQVDPALKSAIAAFRDANDPYIAR